MENISQNLTELVPALAGLVIMVTQILKNNVPFITRNPAISALVMSVVFAVLVVLEQQAILYGCMITFLIVSAANGVYASGKTKPKPPVENDPAV